MSKTLFDAKPKLNSLPENPDATAIGRFPKWLHRKLPKGGTLSETNEVVKKAQLSTVCEEAKCPNRLECYSKKTATFLAMGNACTRACGFCDIDFTKNPLPLEDDEPQRIASSARALGLKHVVITLVARDDLPDQGAEHLAKIIRAIRDDSPTSTVEVLTSDYSGNWDALDIVLKEKPEVFNHNIETVKELTPKVRHQATYERTLELLEHAKRSGLPRFIKSGLMVGLGETEEQIKRTLRDLQTAGCDIVTIGQYLQASRNKLRVKAFVTPEQFNDFRIFGEAIGIKHVYSGPFVRSSYNANLLKDIAMGKQDIAL